MNRWLLYEKLCILKHIADYKHQVWHWHSIPDYHLIRSGFIHQFNKDRTQSKNKQDYGLDALALDCNGVYHGIQCKNWQFKQYLCARDLGSFYQVIYHRLQKKSILSKGFLYYSCKLQSDVKYDFQNQDSIVPIYFETQ
jgi:hypothetical protein